MGCDIHLAVELREVSSYTRPDHQIQSVRRRIAVGDPEARAELERLSIRGGPWRCVATDSAEKLGKVGGEWVPAGFHLPLGEGWHGVKLPLGEGNWTESVATTLAEVPSPWARWRCYATFARLAGVRNYNGVVPISEPRGLPDDWEPPGYDAASVEYGFGDLGDHSHSWLLASEILAYDWGRYKWSDRLHDPHAPLWGDDGSWPVVEMARAWAKRFGGDAVRFTFGFDS